MNYFPSGGGERGYLYSTSCNFRVNVSEKNVKIFKQPYQERGFFSYIFGSKKIKRKDMNTENTNYTILV